MSLSSLSDASNSSSLVAAVGWLQGTLLGTIATTIAVVAIAWVGFMMLMARLEVRRGMTVLAGCFVLFGASSIASGIKGALDGGEVASADIPPPVAPPPTVQPPRRNADPYAGASVPGR